jgi:isopenicillin-N N-acyltransferase-like protein
MADNSAKLTGEPSWKEVEELFHDEQNHPTSICRFETTQSGSGTLFNILMDLRSGKGVVRVGRPTEYEEMIRLEF